MILTMCIHFDRPCIIRPDISRRTEISEPASPGRVRGTGTRLGASLVMLFLAGGVSLEHVSDHGAGKLVFPQEHLPGIILL
jgi:hypothetical protein